jgi:hypothetical protein
VQNRVLRLEMETERGFVHQQVSHYLYIQALSQSLRTEQAEVNAGTIPKLPQAPGYTSSYSH